MKRQLVERARIARATSSRASPFVSCPAWRIYVTRTQVKEGGEPTLARCTLAVPALHLVRMVEPNHADSQSVTPSNRTLTGASRAVADQELEAIRRRARRGGRPGQTRGVGYGTPVLTLPEVAFSSRCQRRLALTGCCLPLEPNSRCLRTFGRIAVNPPFPHTPYPPMPA